MIFMLTSKELQQWDNVHEDHRKEIEVITRIPRYRSNNRREWKGNGSHLRTTKAAFTKNRIRRTESISDPELVSKGTSTHNRQKRGLTNRKHQSNEFLQFLRDD